MLGHVVEDHDAAPEGAIVAKQGPTIDPDPGRFAGFEVLDRHGDRVEALAPDGSNEGKLARGEGRESIG